MRNPLSTACFLAVSLTLLFAPPARLHAQALTLEPKRLEVYYDPETMTPEGGALDPEDMPKYVNYRTTEQLLKLTDLSEAEKAQYQDWTIYAITVKDLQDIYEAMLKLPVQKYRTNPQFYGFTGDEITEDAYYGFSFRPVIPVRDKYLAFDPTVVYYPLCQNRKIIGILTVKKSAEGLSLSLTKDYADAMTRLLTQPKSYQLINYNSNLVACAEEMVPLAGTSVNAALVATRSGTLIKKAQDGFKTSDIPDKLYKMVLDENLGASKWNGWLLNPTKMFNGDNDVDEVRRALLEPASYDFSGTYYLQNKFSNLTLTANGSTLTQEKYTGKPNQKFTFKEAGTQNGKKTYIIVPESAGENMRLDVFNASLKNGAKLQVFKNNPSHPKAQQFRIIIENDMCILLSCLSTVPQKCLEVAGPSTKAGAPVQLWDYVAADNQKWYFAQATE